MTIAIFAPNWIGDAVMATPALRAIRRKHGAGKIIGIMRPHIAPVFAGSGWFDELWVYDGQTSDAMSRTELCFRMRKFRFDLCILFPNSLGTALLAWLGGARERIGFARDGRSLLLTSRLHAPKSNWRFLPFSAVDQYLDLAYAAGCDVESPALELRTGPEDEGLADRVWSDAGIRSGQRVVVCNSSGAFGPAKLWPDEYFQRLAVRLVNTMDAHVLFLCGPDDRERIELLVRAAGHPRVSSLAPYQLSIGLSKACVRRSDLLISTDSGPRHFGAAFGLPVITLFGPTSMLWSDTHYAREVRLQQNAAGARHLK